ncbi:MAG: GNAT family N-acetyltransferase [Promethearchaeota archaeon]
MEKIIRNVCEEDMELLINMYLNDVENHTERAIQFARDLIYRFKTIVCIGGEKILGCITWDTRGGLNDGVGEIVALGITPKFQRQGIARELLLTLINQAKIYFSEAGYKLRVLYLFMERNNKIAHKFYEFMGFREISEIPAFYPHDDAIFWIKYF